MPENSDGSIRTSFKWIQSEKVKFIKKRKTAEVHTEKPHGLKTGNIVALYVNGLKPNGIDWMLSEKLDKEIMLSINSMGFEYLL